MNREDWVWMPHPGHFFRARDCKFVLNTYVGGYIVSTVGELFPDAPVREIVAEEKGIKLQGKGDYRRADYLKRVGWRPLASGRLYETMVFVAVASSQGCCPWRMADGRELDIDCYNKPEDAMRGHLAMSEKWSRKEKP